MYDPTRLAALVAVAEAGSITRAAARLGYTAPALSQQLAKLEREAGATLLVRHHRGARLTAAGELLAGRARRVLDELDQARHELARLAGLSGGRLRVGTFTTAGIHLLPPVLSAFRRAHPEVELAVADYEPPAGIAAVVAGEVDLALTHAYEPAAAGPPPTGVLVEPLLVEELVLVTSVGHRLSEGTGRLPVGELAGRPLISSAPTHPPRRGVENALAEAGATPAVVCESPGYALVCALVSAGLGVAVVPEMVASMAGAPLSVRRLERRRSAGPSRSCTGATGRPRPPRRCSRCCAADSAGEHGPGDEPALGGLTRPWRISPRVPTGPAPAPRSALDRDDPGEGDPDRLAALGGRGHLEPPAALLGQRPDDDHAPAVVLPYGGGQPLGPAGVTVRDAEIQLLVAFEAQVHGEGGRLAERVLDGVGGQLRDDQPDDVGELGVLGEAPLGQSPGHMSAGR